MLSLLLGSVLLLLLFVVVATLSGAWPSSEISAQIMATLAGAVVTAIITMFLLMGQTSSEEKKSVIPRFSKRNCASTMISCRSYAP